MKKKKPIKYEYVCEFCGNPISRNAVKCKWCKSILNKDYYKNKQKKEKKE